MRVLYVDDDRVNALLFAEICRLAGEIELECAGSGEEARSMLERFKPDFLVIDLHLPDTDGLALLAALRSAGAAPPAPAVLCTADDPGPLELRAREAGFDGCWGKPVDLERVVAELRARSGAGMA